MNGWHEQLARSIALDLLRGAKTEIVGTKSLHGISPRYMEIDGVPVEVPRPEVKEATGVRVTLPDGFVALYLASTHGRARSLLDRATQIAAAHRVRTPEERS